MKKYFLLLLLIFSSHAQAQNKKQILANCKQDKARLCSTTSNRTIHTIQCLLENESELSKTCKATLKSSLKKTGKKGASYCKQDVKKYCLWTMPGGGRIIKCLLKNEHKLSSPCRKKLNEV
ncbi:MAG: hypothetical protein AAF518_00095 [Spirochaetota bacterium]